jgi:hypothetical protein
VGHGQDHIIVVAIVIRGRVDLLDPRDFVWPMLLRESRDAAVGELFDPMSGLPHPILDGDGEARAPPAAVEHVPFRTFFRRQGGMVIDKPRPEELEFFPLGIALPGPLFTILSMFTLPLFEGMDKAPCDVGDSVEVVCDLDGSCGSAG